MTWCSIFSTGFYRSYMFLLQSPVLVCSCSPYEMCWYVPVVMCVTMVMCCYGDVLLWWCVAMVTCLLLLSPGAAYCQFMDMLFSGELHQCQADVPTTILSHILHCISVRILAQLCVCGCYQIGKGLAIRQKPLHEYIISFVFATPMTTNLIAYFSSPHF